MMSLYCHSIGRPFLLISLHQTWLNVKMRTLFFISYYHFAYLTLCTTPLYILKGCLILQAWLHFRTLTHDKSNKLSFHEKCCPWWTIWHTSALCQTRKAFYVKLWAMEKSVTSLLLTRWLIWLCLFLTHLVFFNCKQNTIVLLKMFVRILTYFHLAWP